MSNAVFPSLPLLAWPVKRSEIWKTRVSEAESGKQARFTYWSYPKHQWELSFEALRQGARGLSTFSEFAQLSAFFNARSGQFDSFLYEDADDNAVTGQGIGSGDGSTTSFQLVRAFGGYVEPIFAPNGVSAVYLNGVAQSGASYTVNGWGSASPGTLVFTAAPGAGVAITADFSFYFPCHFTVDQLDFEKFASTLYAGKSVKFESDK